jgi:chromosome partitioning protein
MSETPDRPRPRGLFGLRRGHDGASHDASVEAAPIERPVEEPEEPSRPAQVSPVVLDPPPGNPVDLAPPGDSEPAANADRGFPPPLSPSSPSTPSTPEITAVPGVEDRDPPSEEPDKVPSEPSGATPAPSPTPPPTDEASPRGVPGLEPGTPFTMSASTTSAGGQVAVTAPDEAPTDPAAPTAATSDERPLRPLELPRVIALANQKGGVGKTTTAVNLGAALAEADYRVLVVDLDPQGNATTGLGINARDVETSIYDVIMTGVDPEDCIEPTSLRNLFVLPATIDLAGAEIELVPAFSRELKLKRALDGLKDDYDIILIDCPPSLGLLTINGLAAADDVIVPIQCEYYALEGLGQLLRNVSLVRSSLNPQLDVRGIVLTMYDARTKLADAVGTEVRSHFGDKVYRTIVPRTVRLSEAPSFGQPIIVFDPSSRGATAYRELAKEVSGGATRRTG